MTATVDPRVRPLMLVLCIVTWALVGLGILLGASGSADGAYHVQVPTPIRVAEWWLASALATSTLLTGRHTYWTVLALMAGPTVRFTSYGGSWLVWLLPGGAWGDPTAWYQAVYQLPLMLAVVVVALILRPSPLGEVSDR